GNEQKNAFQTFKDHLITAPILQYSDFKQHFYIYTDNSQSGLEAVLAKLMRTKENTLLYTQIEASQKLNKTTQLQN
ncbi:7350_t:CDS:1, partial [Gigaspora rosea]